MTKQQLIDYLTAHILGHALSEGDDRDKALYDEGVRRGLALAIVNIQKLDQTNEEP